jgi:hypothetical protein
MVDMIAKLPLRLLELDHDELVVADQPLLLNYYPHPGFGTAAFSTLINISQGYRFDDLEIVYAVPFSPSSLFLL